MASADERRRAPRHPVDESGDLELPDGRRIAVRIVNLGPLGALLKVHDLEVAIIENERARLVHPVLEDGRATGRTATSTGLVVRVDLDFEAEGVARQLALYFDGGPGPAPA